MLSAGLLAGCRGVYTGPGHTALTLIPLGRKLERKRAGEGDDCAFGRRVVEHLSGSFECCDGRGVDDGCSALHVGEGESEDGN